MISALPIQKENNFRIISGNDNSENVWQNMLDKQSETNQFIESIILFKEYDIIQIPEHIRLDVLNVLINSSIEAFGVQRYNLKINYKTNLFHIEFSGDYQKFKAIPGPGIIDQEEQNRKNNA